MSRLTEIERGSNKEYVFPCDCHHPGHHLRISIDSDDVEWQYMWIEYVQGLDSIWTRLKTAWNCLLGRAPVSGEVVLNTEALKNLRSALNDVSIKDNDEGDVSNTSSGSSDTSGDYARSPHN